MAHNNDHPDTKDTSSDTSSNDPRSALEEARRANRKALGKALVIGSLFVLVYLGFRYLLPH